MHSDPIADLLTRIRNGINIGAASVEVPLSKIKLEIVKILNAEGYVSGYEITTGYKFPNLKIAPRYTSKNHPHIKHLKRVSRPGLRIYKASGELKPIRNGLGTQIVTTNQGVMTDREARKRKIGGEILCEVW